MERMVLLVLEKEIEASYQTNQKKKDQQLINK